MEALLVQDNGKLGMARLAELRKQFGGGANDDLSAGVRPQVQLLTFRGKVWRVVANGIETPMLTPDGDPVPSLLVVIAKANPVVTKTYYSKPYVEGADEAPVCASSDGVKPDAGVPEPQSATCAACRWNQFGSRISPDGQSRGKACTDSRRLVVVPKGALARPVDEIEPLLLRVPPTSLQSLVKLKQQLDRAGGVPYQAVAVRLSFDTATPYPRLLFEAKALLSDDEVKKVAELVESGLLTGYFDAPVVAERVALEPAPVAEPPLTVSEPEMPSQPQRTRPGRPARAAQPTPAAQPAPPAAAPESSLSDLDDLMSSLDELLK